MFADVVLPLAVPGAYTYLLPDEMVAKVVIGTRVVVPLGKTKRYTGIVIRLHDNSPGISYKEVEEIVDSRPLLLPQQIDFWRWMANYYMCFPGEVMKAELPSGLKLESETVYALAEGYVYDEETAGDETFRARQILAMLRLKPLPVATLQKEITTAPETTAAPTTAEDHAPALSPDDLADIYAAYLAAAASPDCGPVLSSPATTAAATAAPAVDVATVPGDTAPGDTLPAPVLGF